MWVLSKPACHPICRVKLDIRSSTILSFSPVFFLRSQPREKSLSPILFLCLSQVWSFDPCSYAFIAELDSFQFRGASDLNSTTFQDRLDNLPVVADFMIGNQSTCAEAQNLCTNNTICTDNPISGSGGYLCSCQHGYWGNPYLSYGCKGLLLVMLFLFSHYKEKRSRHFY